VERIRAKCAPSIKNEAKRPCAHIVRLEGHPALNDV
jgi:hypothetical protein